MIKTYNIIDSLNILTNTLDKHKKVFFSRFGDNDIVMMSGRKLNSEKIPIGKAYGGNKTIWSIELQKELFESFQIKDERYLKGVSCIWEIEPGMRKGVFAPFKYNQVLDRKVSLMTNEKEFLIPILFHYLSLFNPGIFDSFINKYIKPYKKLFIGNIKKELVEKVIGPIDHYVRTPKITAYSTINEWWPKIEEVLDEDKDLKVIIPTCGQSSRVIQKRIWNKGGNYWSIDIGSMFDALDNQNTRTWLRLEGDKIRERYL